ncbi:hypothetical protein ACFS6H_20055 [Terrimonas rubra]|uniref:Uncharacterized protein n=1 Tax=Terrimonas rubra TaxID=1035890 RepID=A0ABW6AC58_9BACT
MNKLTIHHLAKRLPYGVKFVSNGEIFLITDINTIDPFPIWASTRRNKKTLMLEPEINVRPDVLGRGFRLSSIKPILFPLSALTQEITVNGEAFVPIRRILEDSCFDLSKMTDEEINSYAKSEVNVLMSYETAEFFHKYHIDYENLISSGLSISVFDLPENPYK